MGKNILKSKWFIITIGIIIEIILLIVVFKAGMLFGIKKAKFNLEWGRNYGKYFGEPKIGLFKEPPLREKMKNAFGNAGVVLSVASSSIVIKSNDGSEKVIAVNENTTIHLRNYEIGIEGIKVGDSIVVIGEPDKEGKILAKLIRVFKPFGIKNEN